MTTSTRGDRLVCHNCGACDWVPHESVDEWAECGQCAKRWRPKSTVDVRSRDRD